MMNSGLYVAAVRIRTDEKTYQIGEVVEGLPETDMEYLIENGFVGFMNGKELPEEEFPDCDKPNTEDDIPEGENPEDDVPELYTEEQLNKLPSKTAIAEYAESIGLPGLDTKLHKPELIDKVLEYIEEVQKRDDV